MDNQETIHRCVVCGFELSDEDFKSLPLSANCPECGVGLEDFEEVSK